MACCRPSRVSHRFTTQSPRLTHTRHTRPSIDKNELKAASGCFGLLGIVTAVTLRIDKMSSALLQPEKPRIPLAIPPPKGYKVPRGVDMRGISQADLDAALIKFQNQCHMDYAEWFWFPYNRRGWVNCWNMIPDVPAQVQTFPAPYVTISINSSQCD